MKNRNSPATIVDIAAKTGLSSMTVSRVLRGMTNHSEATIKKVQKAAVELNYRENIFAKALKGGKTGIILCLFPHFSDFDTNIDPFFANPVFSELLVIIESKLLDQGFKVMLQAAPKNTSAEAMTQILNESYADGVIVHGIAEKNILQAIRKAKPFSIFIDENKLNISHVGQDNRRLGEVAADYLWGLGHRRFSVFAHQSDEYHQLRVDGFTSRVQKLSGNSDIGIEVSYGDGWLDGGIVLAKQFIKSKSQSTALFCSNDGIASQAMQHFQQNNILIPQKLSLLGCDNNPISRILSPKLSTIGYDQFHFAMKIVESLDHMIKLGTNQIEGFKIDPHAIPRETTAENPP